MLRCVVMDELHRRGGEAYGLHLAYACKEREPWLMRRGLGSAYPAIFSLADAGLIRWIEHRNLWVDAEQLAITEWWPHDPLAVYEGKVRERRKRAAGDR